jgi:hypothetical protein
MARIEVVGITVPKRYRCAVCRKVRKTDCWVKIEISGGMKYGERKSLQTALCPECAKDSLRGFDTVVGGVIFSEALENPCRTMVKLKGVV